MVAALPPPRLIAAWRVEAFFFFAVWWEKCKLQSTYVPCDRETADILSCYFQTAIWLGKCQSILTQALQPATSTCLATEALHFAVRPVGHWDLCPSRVAVGSTKRTYSTCAFIVARRCKPGSPWKRFSRSSTTTLAMGCSSTARSVSRPFI